ncbi:MAG: hypothetical protein ACYC1K_02670 [Minisyncoccota bacterium]
MPKINLNFKKVSLMRGGSFLGWGQSAHRDWKIILTGFIVAVLFSLLFSFLVFKQINNAGGSTASQNGTIENSSIDTTLLKKIISYYDDQSKKFEKIKSNKISLPDPSI